MYIDMLLVVLLVVCVSLYSLSLYLCLSVSLVTPYSVSGSRYLSSCMSRAPRVPLRSYLFSSYSMLRRIDAVVDDVVHLLSCCAM